LKIALIGSVSFSRVTLEGLIRNGADVCGVLGLAESASKDVSDYARMDDIAAAAHIPYADFVKVNAPEVVEHVRAWQPDVLFVVGLSQLVHDDILRIPKTGSIGFHPTRLPIGRGRAPVAWMTWDETGGAANFFVLEREADSGAIFVQEPFEVASGAYAMDVIHSVRAAISRALDRWVPSLIAGEWSPVPQDESRATFWGKRSAEDGLIDWRDSAADIARLVRTASRPYPGAYTYARDRKLIVWRAAESDLPFRGVPGRVLDARDGTLLVQTGHGLLQVQEYEIDGKPPAVGLKLGYLVEDELNRLRERIRVLEEK
jgi:methionyl-tRNA formyltransferase